MIKWLQGIENLVCDNVGLILLGVVVLAIGYLLHEIWTNPYVQDTHKAPTKKRSSTW